MKKKILALLTAFMILGGVQKAPAQTFFAWIQYRSASCQAVTGANQQALCWDTALKVMFTCDPGVGQVCNAPADWKAGGGGWVVSGGNLYPLVLTQNVGIGTSTPQSGARLDIVGGNFHLGANLFQCDAANGCRIDSSNSGATNVTISPTGLFSTPGGYNYTGANLFLNLTRTTDKVSPATGDMWYNSTYPAFVYYNGAILKRIPTEPIFSTTVTPAGSTNTLLWKAPYNSRIETINCIVDPGGSSSAVINIQNCNSNGSSCVSVDTTSITCTNVNSSDDGSLTSPTIAAGNWVNLNEGAVTGSPAKLTVTVKYSQQP